MEAKIWLVRSSFNDGLVNVTKQLGDHLHITKEYSHLSLLLLKSQLLDCKYAHDLLANPHLCGFIASQTNLTENII